MLSKEVFGHILTYRGGKGLRGAMDAWGEGVREIEVEDPGVLLDTNTKMDYESLLAYEKDRQKRGELAFRASISLSREEECFSALTADFLEAVAESGSMLGACQIRDISYSKGWKMLKIAEAQLGIQFLELLKDGLYFEIAGHAIRMAMILKKGLEEAGYSFSSTVKPTSSS